MVPAAVRLGHEVDKLGLLISGKSALVGSSKAVGSNLAAALQAVGLPIEMKDHTRDLGPCTTAGSRRRVPEVRRRRQEARRRALKVKYFSIIYQRASKLYKPGVLAVGSWGHQVIGASPN